MRILVTYVWQLVSFVQRPISLLAIWVIVRLIKVFDENVVLH